MTDKKTFKAFRISNHFSVPGGRRYKRSDYYLARSKGEEDLLTIAQFAHELEDQSTPPPPPPPPAKTTPVETEDPAYEETKSDEPDWSYMTTSAMRAWLDRADVRLPGSGGSKSTHEDLCKDAWISGRRQNPLYGYAGGPVPSPGQAGPAMVAGQETEFFAKAIEAAHAGGFVISQETRDAFEALTAASVETVADATQDDVQEGASAPAPATNADDSNEPTGSTIDQENGSQESQDTTEDVTIHEGEELVVTVGDDGDLSLAAQPEDTDQE